MSIRRLVLTTLASLCALAGPMLLWSTPALAVRGRVFEKSFGKPGSGAGEFSEPSGVAVNDTTHDIYVVDKGNDRVEVFSPTGAYRGQFNGSGTFEVEVGGKEKVETGAAAPTGAFSGPEGIAVDNSCQLHKPLPLTEVTEPTCKESDPSNGDVYVVDGGHNVIDKFSPSGAYLGQLTGGEWIGVAVDQNGVVWAGQGHEIDSFNDALTNEFLSSREPQVAFGSMQRNFFAVDSEDHLYINNFFEGVNKLTSSGGVLKKEIGITEASTATGVAVDLSSNDVYIDNESTVGVFDPSGSPVGRFGSPQLTSGTGIGIDSGSGPSAGNVYVADSAADEVHIFIPEPPSPPAIPIRDLFASNVASASAGLNAQVNPDGTDTTYYFQYGTVSCTASPSSCTDAPAAPGADIGEGFGDQSAGLHLQGLLPSTTYYYRVVAHNALGTTASPDDTFTTQSSGSEFALPDGREWELVSPPNKYGAGIEPMAYGGEPIQAAEAGGAFTYAANAPIVADPAGNRAPQFAQILSTRGAGGWTSQDIATPYSALARIPGSRNTEYDLFSGNLSTALVQPEGEGPLPPLQEGAEKTIYLRSNSECQATPTEATSPTCYLPLVTAANVPPGRHFGEIANGNVISFDDATPDLSHIVLSSPEALTSNFEESHKEESLYEWAGGSLQLVSVLPPNKQGEEKPAAESEEASSLGDRNEVVRNAISNDGSRIVWEAGNHLYLRDMSQEQTIQLDVPQPGAEDELASPEPVFQGASSNGSRIFFTDQQRLTTDSNAKNREPDLYMFEVTSVGGEPLKGELTDLTKDTNPNESANVQGAVLGFSEDGSWVYFVAEGVLGDGVAHGATPGNCELNGVLGEGACNLYMWHDGVTSLIAVLAGRDAPDWAAASPNNLGDLNARVSPNGRYLAFMSERPLTGYDNLDINSEAPDEEVYLFDSATGRMVCASCNPTGARPEGVLNVFSPRLLIDESLSLQGLWLAGSVPGWTDIEAGYALHQSRYLSNEGRLFFDGADALVPADVNHKEDVYEYEPEGKRCNSSTQSASEVFKREGKAGEETAGCVALISSGTSSQESAFLEASGMGPGGEEGEEVFFMTTSPLVAQDTDSAYDVYDAHICSEISPCPASGASVPPACSDADSCRAAPIPQPTLFGAPSSETFSGAGNVTPTPTTRVKPKAKPLTRAQRLAKALKACRRSKSKKMLATCERRARKRYGPMSSAKRSHGKGVSR